MLKTNYHCHTTFCDGKNSVDEMVRAAVAKDFAVLGISSHSAYPFAENWHIAPGRHGEYMKTVRDAAQKYQNALTVLCGFEADYIRGVTKPSLSDEYALLQPDYLIGSVHYVVINDRIFAVDDKAETLSAAIRDFCGGNAKKVVQEYFALEREMLSKGGFTILGHPDLVRKNNGCLHLFSENDDWYRTEIKALADAVKKSGVIAEINTGAIARKKMDDVYPSAELLALLCERKVPITVNSDAHTTNDLDCAFERAFACAKRAGYTESAFLDKDGAVCFQKM